MNIGRLKKPTKRIRSFINHYAWIAYDGLRGKKILVITITSLSMAAAAITALTLGLSGKVLNILQSGKGLHVPYLDISLQGNALIISSALIISALLAFSSYAGFYGRLKTRALARAYYAQSNARLLELVEHRTTFIKSDKDHHVTSLRVMINRNASHISRSLEKIIMMMQPVSYLIAAIVTASYLNLKLSLVSYLLLLFLIVPLYRKSSEFTENSRIFFQKSSTDMNRTLRKYIDYLESCSLPIGKARSVGRQYISEPTVNEYLDRFDRLRLAPVRMVLITSLFMSLIVGMGMLGVGYMLMIENEEIGTALAFMGALVLLLRSMQQLGTSLAMLNRFYPQMVDYLVFYRSLLEIPVKSTDELPEKLVLDIKQGKLPGSEHNLTLYLNNTYNVLCDKKLNRSNLSYIGSAILYTCNVNKTCQMEFAAKIKHPLPLSIRDYLLRYNTSSDIEKKLINELEYFGVRNEIDALPGGFDTIIDDEIWSGLSHNLARLLLVLPLTGSNSQIVLIDEDLLEGFNDAKLHHILSLFSGCFIFVLSNTSGRTLDNIESGFVIENGRIIGAGTTEWLKNTNLDYKLMMTEDNLTDDEELLDDME